MWTSLRSTYGSVIAGEFPRECQQGNSSGRWDDVFSRETVQRYFHLSQKGSVNSSERYFNIKSCLSTSVKTVPFVLLPLSHMFSPLSASWRINNRKKTWVGQGCHRYHLKASWADRTTKNLILARLRGTFLIGWQEGSGWIPGSEVHWKDLNICSGLDCSKYGKNSRVCCCLATLIKINH